MPSKPCPLCHLEQLAATDVEGALWSAVCLGSCPLGQVQAKCCDRHASGSSAAVARGSAHLRKVFFGAVVSPPGGGSC